jgi:hypothetical protein
MLMFMQSKKPPKVISFSCDGCSAEFLETDDYTLRDAAMTLRENNWATAQHNGEFKHYCHGCAVKLGIF